ncbi:MAG: Wzz/FepE/Etk N-terminal domain-containing protein [candidate division Zixibacteria bacterium]|nr:Wzz/FepE/Etk N-terminal domain-containing protein [candidate division Zixibacteria bacterium]
MNQKTERGFDLREYWNLVLRRKWVLILPFLTVTLISFAGSFLITPQYKSSTIVLMSRSQLLSRPLENLVPGVSQTRTSSEERQQRLATITNQIISTSFLRRLIYNLNLHQNPGMVSKARKIKPNFPEISQEELVEKILIDDLRKKIRVNFKGENLIEVTVYGEKPKETADMAKNLAQIFIDESLRYELLGVRGALDFSDEQLTIYKNRLDEAENRLREYKEKTLKNNVDQSIISDTNVSIIVSVIDATKLEINELKDGNDFLKNKLSSLKAENLSLPNTARLKDLKDQLLASVDAYISILTKYSWRDAKVLTLSQRSRNIIDQIKEEVKTISGSQKDKLSSEVSSLLEEYTFNEINLSFLSEKLRVLNQVVEGIKDRLARIPYQEQTLRNLEQDVETYRSIYEMFVSQLQGSQISQQVQQADAQNKFRIIEPATVPLKPVKPNRIKITLLGCLLGLIVGGGGVILTEFFDNSFKKVEEVEEYLGLKVLGTVPRIEQLGKTDRSRSLK